MKKYIPYPVKQYIKQRLRLNKDAKSGINKLFAQRKKQDEEFNYEYKLKQPIFKSYLSENKIHNLQLAGKEISEYILNPGELFSFWNIIGKANSNKGYKKGRNLKAGKIQEEEGGGLCQLSGIIYHAALIHGLEIIERHSHSMDIYTEENRFTPLGADATIVYGYKDLRFKNNTNSPIQFSFIVEPEQLTCILSSTEKLIQKEIIFDRVNEQLVITKVLENGTMIEIEKSVYKR